MLMGPSLKEPLFQFVPSLVSLDSVLIGWVAPWESVGTVLSWHQFQSGPDFGFATSILVLAGKRKLRLR